MALEFRNKKLGLLVIMVLMASPYVYTESNSQTLPAAFADSSNTPQSVGPDYPGTAAGGMWNNLNGVQGGSVGTCASVTGMAGNSRILDLTNFRFNIPSTSIITGVQVGVKAASTNSYAFSAQLLAGGPVGAAKSFARPSAMSTTCASSGLINISSPSDLWGTSLTADQINSGAFGVEINSGQGGAFRYIDLVTVTVYYYVPDTTPPVIDSHLNATAEATSSAGATVAYTPPATKDNYDPPGVATCTPASGSTFALGDTKVTCTATDASGNIAIPTTFNVHVQDTTAPVISAHLTITSEATGSSGATVTYISPATHDAVDGDKVATCTPASGSTFALGKNKVTCTAKDAAGNSALSSFSILVQDTTAPVITTNNDIVAEATGSTFATITANGGIAGGSSGAGMIGTAGKQVNITGTNTYYGGGGGGGSNTFGCSGVTNNGGLGGGGHGGFGNPSTSSDSCSFALAGTSGLGGGGGGGYFSPSANGGSGVVIISYTTGKITATGGTISTFGGKTIHTFTSNGIFTVTSGSTKIKILVVGGGGGGNGHGGGSGGDINYIDNYSVSPNSFAITVGSGGIHDLGTGGGISAFTPQISLAPNLGGNTAVVFTAPTATDAVSIPAVTCDRTSGSTFALGHTKVTCTAKDAAGNSASSSFDILVQDTTAPVITKNTDIAAEATSSAGAAVTYTIPTAIDTVSAPIVTCDSTSGSVFALGDTKVTCTAKDNAGNAASSSFVITVRDTTAPTIGTASDITVEATSSAGAAVTYTIPTAIDTVSAPIVTCDSTSGSVFALGDTKVTCTAKDNAGNAVTPITFNVHVQDTTAPVIDSHDPITMEATDSSGAVVTYTAPATHDAVDGDKVATCTPASGSTFALGDTKVTCNITDAAGNSASSSFNVFVHDTTAPVIAKNTDITAEATSSAGAAVTFTAPTATDAVSTPTVTCDHDSGSTFALDHTKVICTATDAAGNSASSSFDVLVQDTTVPVITTNKDITAEATSSAGAAVTFTTPTATDAVSTPTVTCDHDSGSTFALGDTEVTCTATDAAGNSVSSFFYLMVHDTTAPAIAENTNITEEATSSAGAAVTFTAPTATDAVSSPAVICDHDSGSIFPLGDTEVTCTATDAAGNSASSEFYLMVQDTTAPTITANNDIAAEATSSAGAAVTYTDPIATDAVSTTSITCSPYSGSTFALGDTTVKCDITDDAGNSASSSFDVLVQDTTQPEIDSHGDVNKIATDSSGAVVTYTAPATHDAVDGDKVATCTPASGSTFALGDTKVTCNITDAAGNSASSSFDVLVQDATAPVIASHVPIAMEATDSSGAVVTYTAPATHDDVDPAGVASCTPTSGSVFPLGDTQVTCTAKDTAGNSALSLFDVTVQDTTVPTITSHTTVTAEATSSAGAAVTYTAPTATDAVSSPAVICDHDSGSVFALGDTKVECSATDDAGNSASSFFDVIVQDTTTPVISTSNDITAEATSSAGAAVTFTAPTATDAVSTPTVTCDHDSGSVFALGHTTVTCNAKDIAGNSASSSFDILVQDTTAPAISPNNDIAMAAPTSSGITVTYTAPTATDSVSTPIVTCTPASGSTFLVGDTKVTCSATDAAGNSAFSSFDVIITLVPPNNAPTGTAPAITTQQNTAVTGTMTVADVDGDPLTVKVGTAPTHGTASIIDNSHYRYTPASNYAGSDTFKLDVSDGKLDTFFDASITITAVNVAPTGSAPAVTTTENTAVTGTMTVTDANGDALTVTVSTPPGHGTVSVTDNSHFKYTPSPNYIGSDKFTLKVSDGKLSHTFDVSVSVKDVTPPEALIQFDTVTKTLQVFGTDDSFGRSAALSPTSTTTNSDGSKLNTYKITDPSGNSLTIVEKFTTGTNTLTTSMVSVKYNKDPTTTVAENQQKFSWTTRSSGSIKTLSQEMYLGPNWVTQEISIDYDSSSRTSTVSLEHLDPVQTYDFSGLVIERMTTSNGNLWISY